MSFPQLLEEIKKHPLQELRAHSENYFEAVVSMTKLVDVEGVLVSYFGVPLKPASLPPSSNANRLSKPYGGIRREQTMYFREREGGSEIAFLWPWGCRTLVTLKIFSNNSAGKPQPAPKPAGRKSFWKALFGRWL